MLHPDDLNKTAFQVGTRRYRYRVDPMGIATSAFHIQRQMNKLFYWLIDIGVWIYTDDIVICADTEEEFLRILREVLSILKRSRLKCMFGSEVITILGHVITPEGVRMGKERVDSIAAISFPKICREIRRFWGMCNYMRRHIPHYSEIFKPLSSLVNSSVTKTDTPKAHSAFNALKTAVQEHASLAFIRFDVEIFLQVDASIIGVGGTISKRFPDGDRH